MKFERGNSTRLQWIDANLAYRYDKDKVTPVRMREERPLWRDAGPLLLLNEADHGGGEKKVSFRRPDVVEQAFSIFDLDRSLSVQVYGMRTDMKMKVFEWVKSAWQVPARLGDPPLGEHRPARTRSGGASCLRIALLHQGALSSRGSGKQGGVGKSIGPLRTRVLATSRIEISSFDASLCGLGPRCGG
jgi:hypothetical protein